MLKKLRFRFVCFSMTVITVLLLSIIVLIYSITKSNMEEDSLDLMRSVAISPVQVVLPDSKAQGARLPFFTLCKDKNGNLTAYGGDFYDLSDQDFLEQLYSFACDSSSVSGVMRQYQLRFLKIYSPSMPASPQTVSSDDPENSSSPLSEISNNSASTGSDNSVTSAPAGSDDSSSSASAGSDNSSSSTSAGSDDSSSSAEISTPVAPFPAGFSKSTLQAVDQTSETDTQVNEMDSSSAHLEYIVFADMSVENHVLRNLLRNCIIFGCAGFCIFLLLSIMLAHAAARPVEQAWISQRQFIANASHELKTPLTVILTNAEMLHSEDFPPEIRTSLSNNILAMSRQMRGLVEKLLDLARAESGIEKNSLSSVCLSRIINDTIMMFEAVFYERGITMLCQIEPERYILGDAQQLTQLVSVFLDNAQKYADDGTVVEIHLLENDRRRVILEVSNICSSFSQKDIPHLFRRFYRSDHARAMNHSYGLGLSIADALVRSHKGKISCTFNEDIHKVTFRVVFRSSARKQ